MVIKWLENHLNVFKRSNDPWNFPNFHMTVVLVHVKRRKKIEDRKRKLSPVRHQTCIVPSQNHEPSSELLRFVRVCVQIFVKHANFFTTSSWCYDIKSSKVSRFFWSFFWFFGIKMPWHAIHACAHALTPICSKIPYNLLHMELIRTQIHKNIIFQTVMVSRCMYI